MGYGSPQIATLMTSLMEHYHAEGLVVEPNRPDLSPRHNDFPSFRIQRTPNRRNPYSEEGRIEYLIEASHLIDLYSPDVLVLCSTFCIPVLFQIAKRPSCVIYYSYESIPFYGDLDVRMNQVLDGMVDIVVFPEENRARLELQRFGFRNATKVILYNCPDIAARQGSPLVVKRNDRLIQFGTIDKEMTLADYYTRPEVQSLPIDLFGPVRAGSAAERSEFLSQIGGSIRYRGQVSSVEIATLRKAYAYSIVVWNPSVENQLYAAPNKFFESIADGLPPIAAPHPQCKLLIERYQCGLLMPDWSYGGFLSTLHRALEIYPGPEWHSMVRNCTIACERELNWDHQFQKLRVHLRD